MIEAVSYKALRKALESLGFVHHRVPGSHVYYSHRSSPSEVFLPDVNEARRLHEAHFLAVRKNLVDNGLVEPKEFESLLQREAATNGEVNKHRR